MRFKKLLAPILALLMTITLFSGCSAGDYTAYAQAITKTGALSAAEFAFTMNIQVGALGAASNIPIDGTMKITDAQSGNPQIEMNMNMSAPSYSAKEKLYFTGGYMYVDLLADYASDSYETKLKQQLPLDKLLSSDSSMAGSFKFTDIDESAIKGSSKERVDSGMKYTFTIDGARIMDIFGSLLEGSLQQFDSSYSDILGQIQFSDVDVYYIIGDSGYITEESVALSLNSSAISSPDQVTSITFDFTLTLINMNDGVQIDFPDFSDYKEQTIIPLT